tara:strand:- start:1266 stop:1661 length:396 start_codon:yes stop_codon:yes gene_type:complete
MKSFLTTLFILFVTFLPFKAEASHIDLKPCIQTSHCVREEWIVEDIKDPLSELQIILENTPRIKITEIDGDYLHAEATSRFMKYIDDLEISYKNSENELIVRSESRMGEGDFGVNQKRVDLLKSNLFNIQS